MTARLELTASTPAELTLAATPSSVDLTRRLITGLLIPADATGSTSAGVTRFAGPSAVSWHAELRRVKLLREHQTSDALGYAVELAWKPEGLVGTFYVPESPTGDRALAEARDGIRDGLSVGVYGITGHRDRDDVLTVTASQLRECSVVSIPAFDDSRVLSVTASTTNPAPPIGVTVFTPAQLAAARAAGIDTNDPAAVRAYLDTLTASASSSSSSSSTVAPGPAPAQLTASEVADELVERLRAGSFLPNLSGPNGTPGASSTGDKGLDLDGFARLVASTYTGNGDVTQLRAALSDVVPADAPSAFRPQYLDELWDGAAYSRKFIDNATTVRPLTSGLKIVGQRWVTKPQVADYLGDKTAVPSGDVVLEDVEAPVKRLAGAHDVDRAYIDLGSPAWLASYFEAQTESYQRKSDAAAAAAAYAGATILADDDATPATFPTLLEGVVAAVVAAATVGEPVEYVALAPGLIAELLGITTANAPAFFGGTFQLTADGDGVLGGAKFFTTPGLTGSQFLVGNKAAVRYHEATPPIRVQALNIAQGGIDLGVFGYHAEYVRNAAGIRRGTVGA